MELFLGKYLLVVHMLSSELCTYVDRVYTPILNITHNFDSLPLDLY